MDYTIEHWNYNEKGSVESEWSNGKLTFVAVQRKSLHARANGRALKSRDDLSRIRFHFEKILHIAGAFIQSMHKALDVASYVGDG